jgi:hypothetical protein
MVCWFAKNSAPLFLKLSLGAMALSHLVCGVISYRLIRDQANLRDEYPTESLAGRLAYEASRPSARQKDNGAAKLPKPISAEAAQDIYYLENEVDRNVGLRRLMLLTLHRSSVETFINSPGFGISRQIQPDRKYVELPEPEAIPLPLAKSDPVSVEESLSSNQTSASSLADEFRSAAPGRTLSDMHRESIVDFVNPKGFGYIKDREHVSGFQSHQFREMPDVSKVGTVGARWQIQRLELVSLLTHAEPVAYVSANLPRMDELRKAQTRPLSAFERNALTVLQSGEDLKIESNTNRIRAFGAIRAVNQCTACHEVERGELLGAFSYLLWRASSGPVDREVPLP